MENIKRIVLTGGPCAGKTTALVRIIEHFSNLGFKVFTVPEVPTMYSQGGWSYLTPNHDLYYEGELAILQTQLALEDNFMRLAETCTRPTFVVCDRGTLDISAYIDKQMWGELCEKCGTSANDLRNRYDAVLHLVSAADGAEQYYTTATNSTRYEQANVKEERVYLVEITGELPECIESEITQTYLVADPDCEVRLRRRSWSGEFVNVHKTKKRISANEILETERQVSNALYESLLQQADPYRATIRKTRRSFIWKGQYFEIDSFHAPVDNLVMLQTKGVERQETVNFPPFLRVVADVTGNPQYYNYNIALRK